MTDPTPVPAWPRIELEAPSQADLQTLLQRLQAVLGPLPQAEALEPWELDEPYVLRVDLPGLSAERARDLRDAGYELQVGLPPGASTARDQDAVVADVIEGGGLSAVLWSDAVEGGLCVPDLHTQDPDPAGAAMASELVAALRQVSAELVPDVSSAVDFVGHRPTGRRGLRLQVPSAPLQGLEGQALLELRRDVVAAVAGVVARRPRDLAPDLLWDPRLGLSVLAWRRDARGPVLPGDSVVEAGLQPAPDALRALDLAGRTHALEIQVVPVSAAHHHAAIDAVLPLLQGLPVQGAEPRWVYARGPGPAFCPTWRAPAAVLAQAEQREPLLEVLVELAALPDVYGVRVVPVAPVGLEEAEPFLDPAWRWVGARWVARWRDGVRDRDRLVAWIPRGPEPADAPLVQALGQALSRGAASLLEPDSDGRVIRPIVDDTGRPGLALHGPPELAFDAPRLGVLLGLLGRIPLPGVSDVVDLALPVDGVVLHLWRRPDAAAEGHPPAWVSVG